MIGLSCCYLIAACERVRDYDRALQWCARLKVFCERWGLRPLFAVCRTQYASICMWRGTWLEAEAELTAATSELAASRPAMTADGLVRLAELRRRQGRLVEAAEMFDQAESHSLALLGRAQLAFDRDDAAGAAELAARYMRRVPAQNRTARAEGLEVLVRALVATGDLGGRAYGACRARRDRVAVWPPRRFAPRRASLPGASPSAKGRSSRRSVTSRTPWICFSSAVRRTSWPARASISARTLAARQRLEAAADEAERAVELLRELHAEFEMARARSLVASFALPAVAGASGERTSCAEECRTDEPRAGSPAARRGRRQQPGDW